MTDVANELLATMGNAAPPDNFGEPAQAMWWLAKGNWQMGAEWEAAHELCQRGEGTVGYDLAHALAHWIEGDRFNSDYWYRRAGQARHSENAQQEWQHLLAEFSADIH